MHLFWALRGAFCSSAQVALFLCRLNPNYMNDSPYVTGPCIHCKTNLEFDPENAGEIIACPDCGKNTVLLLNDPDREKIPIIIPRTPANNGSVKTSPEIHSHIELNPVHQPGESESVSGRVSEVSDLFLRVAIAALIIGIVGGSVVAEQGNALSGEIIFGACAVAAVQFWIVSVLVQVLAEILNRLRNGAQRRFVGTMRRAN